MGQIQIHNMPHQLIIAPSSSWCRFGLRDPSVLCHPDGTPVQQDGKICIYFNGRDKSIHEGGMTRIGMAWASSCLSVIEQEKKPVFEDGWYAAQGSVLQTSEGRYVLFYSHGTDLGFKRAFSEDRNLWYKEERVLLTPDQFGCTRIGLPFVQQIDNMWLMLFEGIHGRNFRIFAAFSHDGSTWFPANQGQPIFISREDAWDGGGQANPSLMRLAGKHGGTKDFVLLYNGHARDEPSGWDIGMCKTSDPFNSPWEKPNSPFLRRKDMGLSRGRLEGARLLQLKGEKDKLLFFALPGKDSYQGGAIYAAECSI